MEDLARITLPPGWRLDHRADTGSTNADAAAAARDGAAHGLVVVADVQTAGRGRLDRTWTAAPGDALLVSVLLRDVVVDLGWVPLLAGVAVVEAVGLPVGLKWPNDVLADDGRKLAGVLAEAVPTPDGLAVVLGIGLNLRTPPVPTATSTDELGGGTDRPALLAALCAALDRGLADPADPRGRYLALCRTVGAAVRAELPGGRSVAGVALDVDATGRLVVAHDGTSTAVAAGDVVHLRPAL